MFTNVVVGVDGREGGRDATALANQLAEPDARITLANVDRTGLIRGRVWRGLQELADDEHADLVVVGASHRGTLGRLVLGDNSRDTMRTAPCAVAIAPPGYADLAGGLSVIGLGYDGSLTSDAALAAARQIADRQGATVKALAVIPLHEIPYGELVARNWPAAANHLMKRLHGFLDIEGDIAYGLPAEQLEAFSDGMDLLIVGSRSLGAMGRVLEGSTSSYLAGRVKCPLLVMTPGAVPDDAQESRDVERRVAPSA